jgi:predicted methyltransferase
MRSTLAIFGLLVAAAVASNAFPQAGKGGFKDTQEWARRLDDPARDAWQKPEEVIRALGLPAEAVVADIGSGTGYFTVRLARALPRGRVYGVDG